MVVAEKIDTQVSILKVAVIEDSQVQRRLDMKRANSMGNAWDWDLYDPITVNYLGGGKIRVIDGQHRLEAAKIAGIKELSCRVLYVPPVDEYRIYVELSLKRKQQDVYHIYLNRIQAGDKDALELRDILNTAGLKAARSGNNNKNITCIGTLIRLQQQNNGDFAVVMPKTLYCIQKAWEEKYASEHLSVYACNIIVGIYSFLQKKLKIAHFSLKDFVNALARISPLKIDEVAAGKMGYSRANSFLTDLYNGKKTKNTIPY